MDLLPSQGPGLAKRDRALNVRRGELASELANFGLELGGHGALLSGLAALGGVCGGGGGDRKKIDP
jgi:hypothetical protein